MGELNGYWHGTIWLPKARRRRAPAMMGLGTYVMSTTCMLERGEDSGEKQWLTGSLQVSLVRSVEAQGGRDDDESCGDSSLKATSPCSKERRPA